MTAKSKAIPPAAASSVQNGFSLISNEKLVALYCAMLKCRMLEERARQAGKSGSRQAAAGREAAVAGVLLDLGPEDALATWPGDRIAAFIKGVPLGELVASRGAAGYAGHAPRGVLPDCAEPATRLALATGVALAAKGTKQPQLVVVFYDGEAKTPEPWRESLRIAGRHALPVIYVCWNRRPEWDLYLEAEGFGFPGIAVDGSDVVAVYRVACEAIAHARRGNGATLIECKAGLRFDAEDARGGDGGDPLVKMERYLDRKGLFSEDIRGKAAAGFRAELAAARNSRAGSRKQ
jgi:TPP-dependent pyruvate/acetoin dehydrogenase alpha subunit